MVKTSANGAKTLKMNRSYGFKIYNLRGISMDKQITMKLPDEMYHDLKVISEKKGNLPIGNIIRRAVDDYIRKNKMKGIL